MRVIRTFIVRLMVDTDDKDTLRGALREVSEDVERPFTDERSLLALLYQICLISGAAPMAEMGDESQGGQT